MPRPKSDKPKIRKTREPELSPFVVYLHGVPVVQPLIETPRAVDFLKYKELEELKELKEPQPTLNDLTLNPNEVRLQLFGSRESLPHFKIRIPSLLNHPRVDANMFAPPVDLQPSIHLDAFAPPQVPEDIFAMFDWPEEEEQKELKELEELEGLEELTVEPETVAAGFPARQSFSDGGSLRFERTLKGAPTELHSFLPHGWKKAAVSFVAICLAVVLPLHVLNFINRAQGSKARAQAEGGIALAKIESGFSLALDQNPQEASRAFAQAQDRFGRARKNMEDLGALKHIKGADALVDAGDQLARAAQRLTEGLTAMDRDPSGSPTTRLSLFTPYLSSAVASLQKAQDRLQKVHSKNIPPEHRALFQSAQTQLPILLSASQKFLNRSDALSDVLGAREPRHYLVVFQNNTELRPTGGFMGSFAEITLSRGNITRLNIPKGGTYDLQGGQQAFVQSPRPLQLLSPRWEFQDTNWFADFPTSANKILQFYESANGPTADGVIAINATWAAGLLDILGEMEMPEYGRTVNAENFLFETQKAVEVDYDKAANRPKSFLADLGPRLLERTLDADGETFLQTLEYLVRGLDQKDIQVYLRDNTLQKNIREMGWAGEMAWTAMDYLMIVDTNLGGGKTDGVIEQRANLDVHIGQDGRITNTLTITKTHFGYKGALFEGVNNVDYLRVYVPKGSTLIDASGFDIPPDTLFEAPDADWLTDTDIAAAEQSGAVHKPDGTHVAEEFGKTVFGNWMQTKPGESSTITFTYALPFTLPALAHQHSAWSRFKGAFGWPATDSYTLTVQKQSGVMDRQTAVYVETPENAHVLWSSHDPEHTLLTNDADTFLSVLLEPASL